MNIQVGIETRWQESEFDAASFHRKETYGRFATTVTIAFLECELAGIDYRSGAT